MMEVEIADPALCGTARRQRNVWSGPHTEPYLILDSLSTGHSAAVYKTTKDDFSMQRSLRGSRSNGLHDQLMHGMRFLVFAPRKECSIRARISRRLVSWFVAYAYFHPTGHFRSIACDKRKVLSFTKRSQQRRQLCVGSSTVASLAHKGR
jgi:hypothetical protein